MTTQAEAECRHGNWAFDETFRHQYVILPADQRGPKDWKSRKFGDWRLCHCPDLPVCTLTLSDRSTAGVVLGHAIDPEGMMLDAKHILPVNARDPEAMQKAEDYLAQLAGRYVILLTVGKTARVYPDPVCGMGPVYNPVTRRVGTSTLLVLDREVRDNPDVPAADVAEGGARYLFGHTADADTRRARSNHYLDLDDFTEHRHWPKEDMCFESTISEFGDIKAEITERLGRNIGALSGRYPTALPITGGMDSRLLFAAAQDCLNQINQFYVYHTNWANSIDTEIALEIAWATCLPLRVISAEAQPVQRTFKPWQMRHLIAKSRLRGGLEPLAIDRGSIRAVALIPQDHLLLRGNVAEMTRALRWHPSVFDDPDNTVFGLDRVDIRKETAKRYDFWTSCYHDWKVTLPQQALPRIYDFLHMELWLPHTHSLGYIREGLHFMINPFNDRRLIHLTSMVPPAVRKRGTLVNDIVAARVPEISDIHYRQDRVRAANKAKAAVSE